MRLVAQILYWLRAAWRSAALSNVERRNAPKQTLSTSQGPWRRCQRAEPRAGSPVQMERRRVAGSYPLYPMVEVLREFPGTGVIFRMFAVEAIEDPYP